MKLKLAILLLISALALPLMAQSNTPSLNLPVPFNFDWATNLPVTTNFASASLSLETGVSTQNGQVANYIKVDKYLATQWMVSLEIQNAPVSTILDSASLFAGWRKAWANAEIYAEIGVRRTFDVGSEPPSFQGVLLAGASWFPVTGGHVALTASTAFTTSPHGNALTQRPGFELRAGAKLLF